MYIGLRELPNVYIDRFAILNTETYFICSNRGNSKYHYYGLRIKAGSSLLRLMEDQQHLAMRQQPFSQKQRCTHKHPYTHSQSFLYHYTTVTVSLENLFSNVLSESVSFIQLYH